MRAELLDRYGLALVFGFCLVSAGISVADYLLCGGGPVPLLAELVLPCLIGLFSWQHFHVPADRRHTGDVLIIVLSGLWMCIRLSCFAADLLQKVRLASLPFNAALLALLFFVLFFSEVQDLIRRWSSPPPAGR